MLRPLLADIGYRDVGAADDSDCDAGPVGAHGEQRQHVYMCARFSGVAMPNGRCDERYTSGESSGAVACSLSDKVYLQVSLRNYE